MVTRLKIGIICNHSFGIPAINLLLNNNMVAGFAVPEISHPATEHLNQIATRLKIPFERIGKTSLSNDIIKWLTRINADYVFVFSFPYKIPEDVLKAFANKFINFHPSQLPAYRGPDPLFWQIKNGETKTAVTAHLVNKNLDEGAIISTEQEVINTFDTYGVLETKLGFTTLRSVEKVINILLNYNLRDIAEEQDRAQSSFYGRPKETDLIIDWDNKTGEEIANLVRACNPKYQGAVTFIRNLPIRFLEVKLMEGEPGNMEPGSIADIEEGIKIATRDGKIIFPSIVYLMEGCFTGQTFQQIFKLGKGERFGLPQNKTQV